MMRDMFCTAISSLSVGVLVAFMGCGPPKDNLEDLQLDVHLSNFPISFSKQGNETIRGEQVRVISPTATRILLRVPYADDLPGIRDVPGGDSILRAYRTAESVVISLETADMQRFVESSYWKVSGQAGTYERLTAEHEYMRWYWPEISSRFEDASFTKLLFLHDAYIFLYKATTKSGAETLLPVYIEYHKNQAPVHVMGEIPPMHAFVQVTAKQAESRPYVPEMNNMRCKLVLIDMDQGLHDVLLSFDGYLPNMESPCQYAIEHYESLVRALSRIRTLEGWEFAAYRDFMQHLEDDAHESVSVSSLIRNGCNEAWDAHLLTEEKSMELELNHLKGLFPPYARLVIDCGEDLSMVIASKEKEQNDSFVFHWIERNAVEAKIVNLQFIDSWHRLFYLPEFQEKLGELIAGLEAAQ